MSSSSASSFASAPALDGVAQRAAGEARLGLDGARDALHRDGRAERRPLVVVGVLLASRRDALRLAVEDPRVAAAERCADAADLVRGDDQPDRLRLELAGEREVGAVLLGAGALRAAARLDRVADVLEHHDGTPAVDERLHEPVVEADELGVGLVEVQAERGRDRGQRVDRARRRSGRAISAAHSAGSSQACAMTLARLRYRTRASCSRSSSSTVSPRRPARSAARALNSPSVTSLPR